LFNSAIYRLFDGFVKNTLVNLLFKILRFLPVLLFFQLIV